MLPYSQITHFMLNVKQLLCRSDLNLKLHARLSTLSPMSCAHMYVDIAYPYNLIYICRT